MNSYTVIVLIFGVIILILLIGLFFYNRLTLYKKRIDNSLIIIYDFIEIRIQLIEQMIDFIHQNLEYEKSYLVKLRKTKKYFQVFSKKNPTFDKFYQNEELFLHFTLLEEVYTKLKKNKGYQEIKEKALNNQGKLVYALDSYDKGVANYNNYRRKKIVFLISKLFFFPKYECYSKKL